MEGFEKAKCFGCGELKKPHALVVRADGEAERWNLIEGSGVHCEEEESEEANLRKGAKHTENVVYCSPVRV